MNVYGFPFHHNTITLFRQKHDYSAKSLSNMVITPSLGKSRACARAPCFSQGSIQNQPLKCIKKKLNSPLQTSIKIIGKNTTIKKKFCEKNQSTNQPKEERVLGNFLRSLVGNSRDENLHTGAQVGSILLSKYYCSFKPENNSINHTSQSKQFATHRKSLHSTPSISDKLKKKPKMSIETMKQKYRQLFGSPSIPIKKKCVTSARKFRDTEIVPERPRKQCITPFMAKAKPSQESKIIYLHNQESLSSPSLRDTPIYSSHNTSTDKVETDSKVHDFSNQVNFSDLIGKNPYRIQNIQFPHKTFWGKRRSRYVHSPCSSQDNRVILELPRMDAL